MRRINSRAKGKRGELLARDLLRSFGFKAVRGQQYKGNSDSPDVIHDIEGVHIEVKWVNKLNIWEAMAQARRDCGGKTPVVLHKKDGTGWLATLPADALLRLLGGEDYSDL